jgi:hypothetical protein
MPPALFTQELHPAPQPLLSVSRSLWDEASTPRKRKAPEQSCVLKDIAGSSCHQCKSRRSHDELHFCRSFALADSKDDERVRESLETSIEFVFSVEFLQEEVLWDLLEQVLSRAASFEEGQVEVDLSCLSRHLLLCCL